MQSLTEILFTSWIGIFVIVGSAFMFGMGFWFRYWIRKNIAREEAEIARKDKSAHNAPPAT
ncbi:MAG: DUF3149 domain-containing protein [Proteobacteria bacterium]|nr:DUF3149 domain-containing protein [Pseudomonadota bacterium]